MCKWCTYLHTPMCLCYVCIHPCACVTLLAYTHVHVLPYLHTPMCMCYPICIHPCACVTLFVYLHLCAFSFIDGAPPPPHRQGAIRQGREGGTINRNQALKPENLLYEARELPLAHPRSRALCPPNPRIPPVFWTSPPGKQGTERGRVLYSRIISDLIDPLLLPLFLPFY
jgi:hypothetical protein